MAEKKTKKKTVKPYSTKSNSEVASLLKQGFHVESQALVDGQMVYTFKESEDKIKKES